MPKQNLDDLLNYAWTIICNAGGGDWETQSDEWQGAAAKFRMQYHAYLDTKPRNFDFERDLNETGGDS